MSRARRSGAALGVVLGGLFVLAPSPNASDEKPLPAIGTELGSLPDGPVKALADQACLHCHSADMIRQQRLTEKQWTAEVTKMVGWGAAVPEDQRAALVAYLVEHFGPANDSFRPVEAQPVGR